MSPPSTIDLDPTQATVLAGVRPDGSVALIALSTDSRVLTTDSGGGGGGGTVDQGAAGAAAWLVKFAPATPSSSQAYEKGRVLKDTGGTFLSLYVELDPSLPSDTYYAQLFSNSAALPADGAAETVTHLRPPQRIEHTMGSTTSTANFFEGERGIEFSVGVSCCVSLTQFAKTEVAGAALFAGSIL